MSVWLYWIPAGGWVSALAGGGWELRLAQLDARPLDVTIDAPLLARLWGSFPAGELLAVDGQGQEVDFDALSAAHS